MELGRVIENRTNFRPNLQAEIDLIVQSSGKKSSDGLQLQIVPVEALVKLLRENRLQMDPVVDESEEYGKLLALVDKKGLLQVDRQTRSRSSWQHFVKSIFAYFYVFQIWCWCGRCGFGGFWYRKLRLKL